MAEFSLSNIQLKDYRTYKEARQCNPQWGEQTPKAMQNWQVLKLAAKDMKLHYNCNLYVPKVRQRIYTEDPNQTTQKWNTDQKEGLKKSKNSINKL